MKGLSLGLQRLVYIPGLMILGSGLGADFGLGLLDIAPEAAILVSLEKLGLGSSGRLSCGSLVEEPCATVVWSLQKLPGAVCEERNSNGAFYINSIKVTHIPPMHLVCTLMSQHANTSSN